MLKRVKSRTHQKDPFLLMGDLNATTENPAVTQLLESGLFTDHGKTQKRSSSHWKAELVEGLRIDHIFTSGAFEEAEVEVEINGDETKHAGSDHHPVRLRVRRRF
jgi:endonuclease/exonuclease/phosphatase family metal-dependent hydrolase